MLQPAACAAKRLADLVVAFRLGYPARFHEPTINCVTRRTGEGLTKEDIIRCLKRFLAREVYQRVTIDHRGRLALISTP
jgi:hypothetical protein